MKGKKKKSPIKTIHKNFLFSVETKSKLLVLHKSGGNQTLHITINWHLKCLSENGSGRIMLWRCFLSQEERSWGELSRTGIAIHKKISRNPLAWLENSAKKNGCISGWEIPEKSYSCNCRKSWFYKLSGWTQIKATLVRFYFFIYNFLPFLKYTLLYVIPLHKIPMKYILTWGFNLMKFETVEVTILIPSQGNLPNFSYFTLAAV